MTSSLGTAMRTGLAAALFCGTPLAERAAVAQSSDHRALARHALTHAGNAERGRRLFDQEQLTQCLTCHRVEGRGGEAGPDLSAIGGKFDRPHLIESLLDPSRQIVEGYATSTVVLSDGRVLTGVIRQRSDIRVTLFDVKGRATVVPATDIEEIRDSDVSLMPDNPARDLSPEQFTDLIAYLESLRSGRKPTPGGGATGPIQVPDGYSVDVVTTALTGATAMEVLPNGDLLVCEQTGAIRLIRDGHLREEPFLQLAVDSRWERGVIGIAADPQYPAVPAVYVCRVVASPWPHHVISRFRVTGSAADMTSEQILLTGDNQNELGGKVPAGHQGGGLHFGPDGCLFIGIGEQTAGTPSQDQNSFLGKILRIHPDGSVPRDNPFVEQSDPRYHAVWALGCRNPFTFAIRESDGLMLINDVGGRYEEINRGLRGANYGWPAADHGPVAADSGFIGPIHWYPQASIAGGDFAPPAEEIPAEWVGEYFFADFVHGWIRRLDPDRPEVAHEFASGLRRPVDLRFGNRGELYVLLRNAWVIDDKFAGDTGSLLRITRRLPSAAPTN